MADSSQVRAGSTPRPDNLKGALWALLAVALYAVVAAMAKAAVTEFHVLQILFFRQIVVFLSCVPSLVKTFPGGFKTRHPAMHVARLLGAFVALSCSIWAVAVLPLTTATTLGFVQAFFVVLLSSVFLNEKFGAHRFAAIVIGFVGVVVVMRPGVEGIINVYALIPMLAALGASVAVISVRKLSQTESTATLLIYQATFVGLLSAIPLFWFWVTPDVYGTLFLLAMGVVATAGQWIGVKALRLGEAGVIANTKYMELLFAAIFGVILFSEVPDIYTVVGAAIIVSSSVYIVHREALKDRR